MKRAIILLSLLSLPTIAVSKTYMCKDDEGNTMFSDSACGTIEREEVKDMSGPSAAALEERAIQGCLAYLKKRKPYLNKSTTRVEGYEFRWVAVKDVGLRRMLTMRVSSSEPPKQSGGPDGHSQPLSSQPPQPFECLLLGDGVSVNTYEYELVPLPN